MLSAGKKRQSQEITRRCRQSQECKSPRRENLASSGKRRSYAGKPRCRYHCLCGGALLQGNSAWLTYAAATAILCCLKTDTDVVSRPLTFWPQNILVSRLILEHLCVKFGDPSCISFWEIVWKIRQAAVLVRRAHRSSVTAVVGVDEEDELIL